MALSCRRAVRALLAAAALALPAAPFAEAAPPAWANAPLLGLDEAGDLAGVGRADFAPDMRISSAIAYAGAVKALSESLTVVITQRSAIYAGKAGQRMDLAIKDLAKSPLGASLSKTYGDENADKVGSAIRVRRLEDENVRFYVQEAVDVSSRTLYVRAMMSRATVGYMIFTKENGASGMEVLKTVFSKLNPLQAAAKLRELGRVREALAAGNAGLEQRLGGDFTVWKGRNIRFYFDEIRVGEGYEYKLFVEDLDEGLGWIEHWPSGGADLLKNGEVVEKYVYDRYGEQWELAKDRRPLDRR